MTLPPPATLEPADLVADHAFPDASPPHAVDVQLYGLVLDCPCCRRPTTALLAFLPTTDPTWHRRRVVLCNTETSLAVADTALPELAHIENTVGRPAYNTDDPAQLKNGCFHCDSLITGDDLADEVRRGYLDALVDLGPGHVPADWLAAAVDGAGTFLDHGDVPTLATVPDISHALRVLAD